jgi:ATP-dependent RNA circularization protein (DNA/RNA ligase family)
MTEFTRFPRTPHLTWFGKQPPRGDKILTPSEGEVFFGEVLVVEEKLDGTNLGISADAAGQLKFQTRGTFLSRPFRGQFQGLGLWLSRHEACLKQVILPGMIVFGEWCYAKHSIRYDKLRDWFYVFDVYTDLEGIFWSTRRRNQLAAQAHLEVVPEVARGRLTLPQLQRLTSQRSALGSEQLEGVYLRIENDRNLTARAKLVNQSFVTGITNHWTKSPLQRNELIQLGV